MATLEIQVDLTDLAYDLARESRSLFSGLDHDSLIDFILTLDDQIGELSFTKDLHEALGKVIEEDSKEW